MASLDSGLRACDVSSLREAVRVARSTSGLPWSHARGDPEGAMNIPVDARLWHEHRAQRVRGASSRLQCSHNLRTWIWPDDG